MIEQEIWQPIPGFEGYEVSSLGRVKSLKRSSPHILKPSSSGSRGYPGISLCLNGIMYRRSIHQLVMLVFVGPCPEGQEVCHINGNSRDNRLSNLKYDTHLENMRDAARSGNMGGKLTSEEASRVKELVAKGHSYIVNGKRCIKAGGPIKGRDY